MIALIFGYLHRPHRSLTASLHGHKHADMHSASTHLAITAEAAAVLPMISPREPASAAVSPSLL
jgi:hypothetical protein